MDFLCPLDHCYVSRVKLSSFLYPLSIMTKRGRNCGDFGGFFFLRFYVLGGEIHASVRGSAYLLLLVPYILWPCLHTLCLSLMMYVFFTYLYMCCFFSIFMHMLLIRVCNLLFLFQKYRLSKSTCHKFSSCKVFQEFVLG